MGEISSEILMIIGTVVLVIALTQEKTPISIINGVVFLSVGVISRLYMKHQFK